MSIKLREPLNVWAIRIWNGDKYTRFGNWQDRHDAESVYRYACWRIFADRDEPETPECFRRYVDRRLAEARGNDN